MTTDPAQGVNFSRWKGVKIRPVLTLTILAGSTFSVAPYLPD